MTHTPPAKLLTKTPSRRRRRIPAFHPVPVAPRRDGWTPQRQADFIGWLAQTRCVAEAARRVGMDKTSAYRLRRRPGAAGFANAWDVALGRGPSCVRLSSTKCTGLEPGYRYQVGLAQVVVFRGRYRRTLWKPDLSALLQFLRVLDRAMATKA